MKFRGARGGGVLGGYWVSYLGLQEVLATNKQLQCTCSLSFCKATAYTCNYSRLCHSVNLSLPGYASVCYRIASGGKIIVVQQYLWFLFVVGARLLEYFAHENYPPYGMYFVIAFHDLHTSFCTESQNLPGQPPLECALGQALQCLKHMSRNGLGSAAFIGVYDIVNSWEL